MSALFFAWLVAAPCTGEGVWPTDAWREQASTGREAERAAFESYAFTLEGKDADRRGIRTDGVVITRGGYVVYEKYGRSFTRDMRHIAWSVSKSISSALVGAATLQGFVRPEDSLCARLPHDLQPNCDITLENVLTFGSGLAWEEIYENRSNQASSTLAMLYGVGRDDRTKFVTRAHQSIFPPGEHFEYSTGSTVMLSAAVHFATSGQLGSEWPWTLLFDRIGMRQTTFERDKRGVYTGGSHVWATPRDFAKFGYLYLRDGCWANDRVLPEEWVARSTTVSEVFKKSVDVSGDKPGPSHGWQWWMNRLPEGASRPLTWPNLPEDTFVAIGHWGQYILVIPSLDMVIVRTGDDRDDTFDLDTFGARAVALGRP
jgi:CubicO group peptidase (beta-lactamase class C family)